MVAAVPARRFASGLELSAIGLGCMGMSSAYGVPDDAESIATLERSLELGVTHWDTADVYGVDGSNERLLGAVLRRRREEVTLATKFGFVPGPDGRPIGVDARPERAAAALDASLSRLGVEAVDVYYLHRPQRDIPIEDTVGAMAALVAQGKVRHLGLSEASASTLRRAASVAPVAVLQSEYSLFSRDIEGEIIDTARELGIGIVPYSPLGHGLLTGGVVSTAGFPEHDLRFGLPQFAEGNLEENVRKVAVIAEVAARYEATPAQVALAWLLAQGPDIAPIAGTKKRSYLEQNAGAASLVLAGADLELLSGLTPSGSRYLDESQTNVETVVR